LNIAIFGGSFDPPHTGHELIVQKALEILDIDKLLVVTTYLSPFKESLLRLQLQCANVGLPRCLKAWKK